MIEERIVYKKSHKRKVSFIRLAFLLAIFLLILLGLYKVIAFSLSHNFSTLNADSNHDSQVAPVATTTTEATLTLSEQNILKYNDGDHVVTPSIVRGIYMSSYAASSQTFRDSLTKLLDESTLNTIVIDVKDNDGSLVWNEKERMASSTLKDFIKLLHSKNIYVVARIATFQDPKFVKAYPDEAVHYTNGNIWKDKKGMPWADPSSQKMWDYVTDLAKTSYHEYGFDEINFDYVRYPTDGDMSKIAFKNNSSSTKVDKRENLKIFFEYLNKNLRAEGIKTSADLFGMVTIASDDIGIGQMLNDALANFDFVAPMVYPSHFYPGTLNYKKPDLYPREVIYWSMGNALLRGYYGDHDLNLKNKIDTLETELATSVSADATSTKLKTDTLARLRSGYATSTYKATNDVAYLKSEIDKLRSLNNDAFYNIQKKMRPWYQDFDLNGVDYGVQSVSAEIKGGNELGITSYLLWDASNKYTRGIEYDKIGE